MEQSFMREALREAACAQAIGDIPIGAVVVRDGVIIGRGHNLRQVQHDATLHAEMIAIRQACAAVGDWRLTDCELYVTLEPCAMCAGAIINARMRHVYFGAYDPDYGGAGGRIDLFARSYFGAKTEVYGGILAPECRKMLDDFFANLRKK